MTQSVDWGDEGEVRQTRAQLAEALAQRDEWHRQNGLTRGERDQWRQRAENAERELAELREQIERVRHHARHPRASSGLIRDYVYARDILALLGDGKAADDA